LGLGLFGVACQDDSGGSRGAFIDYWVEGDPWCEHQSCGDLQAKKGCELAWPMREQTEDAIMLAELTSDQLAKCKTSSMAYDECFLALSCGEVNDPVTYCPQEEQRFQLDCASVIDAFDMVPVGGFDDGDGSGPSSLAVATAVCDRSAECEGTSLSTAQRQQCIEVTASAFATVPDPEGFLDCIQSMSCAQLEGGGTMTCLDIDPNDTMCIEADTLSLCSGSGQCSIIHCGDICRAQGLGSQGCGFSAADGLDQCLCSP
jgi:hypothetical protein